MRLWEELSGIIFKLLARPYLKTFREKSPENILRKSLGVLDPEVQFTLKEYVRKSMSPSGGFKNKAGKPDIYYTLFGFFLAESLDLTDLFPSIRSYTENEINCNDLKGVHLHCATILFSKLCNDKVVKHRLRNKVKDQARRKDDKQPAYRAFISLLSCYYLNDFRGLYMIRNQLEKLNSNNPLPSPVIAALLVLQHNFGKPVEGLKKELLSFLSIGTPYMTTSSTQAAPDPRMRALQVSTAGFKAVKNGPFPDLLSTAVSLYALRFAGHDLRIIKPGCLDFIDLLYKEGGFSASIVDPDPDIEYTFYGFLALGSLAD